MNEFHEANRKGWDAVSPSWQRKVDTLKDWRACPVDPTVALCAAELSYLKDVAGKPLCVLGSGDNVVAFALAGLGAKVTSVDISQKQLDIAAGRAEELDLDITFFRADVTNLEGLDDNSFDFVYTGGHVAVWVSDLHAYYAEAVRILRPSGLFIVNEYHPVRRIWKEIPDRLELEFSYFESGPHIYDRSEDVPDAAPGSLPSYEYHWTVSDYVMAILKSGCQLELLSELGEEPEAWEMAPFQGLPHVLLAVGRKNP